MKLLPIGPKTAFFIVEYIANTINCYIKLEFSLNFIHLFIHSFIHHSFIALTVPKTTARDTHGVNDWTLAHVSSEWRPGGKIEVFI